MRVTAKGDALKYIAYGSYILTKSEHTDLNILGIGTSISVAVRVAE